MIVLDILMSTRGITVNAMGTSMGEREISTSASGTSVDVHEESMGACEYKPFKMMVRSRPIRSSAVKGVRKSGSMWAGSHGAGNHRIGTAGRKRIRILGGGYE